MTAVLIFFSLVHTRAGNGGEDVLTLVSVCIIEFRIYLYRLGLSAQSLAYLRHWHSQIEGSGSREWFMGFVG